jgi:hypothetical protein
MGEYKEKVAPGNTMSEVRRSPESLCCHGEAQQAKLLASLHVPGLTETFSIQYGNFSLG